MSGQPRFCRETTDSIAHIEKEFKDCQVDWYFYLWNLSGLDPKSTSYINARWIHQSWRNLDNYDDIKQRLSSRIPQTHSLKGLGIGSYQDESQDSSFFANPTTAPMWVSLLRADLMRRQYEQEENFKYDLIVRTRPDQVIEGSLNIDIPTRHILIPWMEYWGPPGRPSSMSDWFAMGNNEDMTFYCDIITNIQNMRQFFVNPPVHPEILLACYLNENGLIGFTNDNFKIKMKDYSEVINNDRLMDYGDWAYNSTRLKGFVKKGWGNELIWATNDKYCGKMMSFDTGAKFSMHFHSGKDESWYVLSGKFTVEWIDTKDASVHTKQLEEGDVWHNPPLLPHRLICLEKGTVIEVSTPDSVEDNYRVMPGDSQKN